MLRTYRAEFKEVFVLDVPGAGTKVFVALTFHEGERTQNCLSECWPSLFAAHRLTHPYVSVTRITKRYKTPVPFSEIDSVRKLFGLNGFDFRYNY
jgi:hypothetical protein